MKKLSSIFYIPLFLIVLTIDIVNAQNRPYSDKNWPSCIDEGKCIALCAYTNNYTHGIDNKIIDEYSSYVYLNLHNKIIYVDWYTLENEPENPNLQYHKKEWKDLKWKSKELKTEFEEKGKCPDLSYIDISTMGFLSEICFQNNKSDYCKKNASNIGTKFKGTSTIEYDYTKHIKRYFEELLTTDFTERCDDFDINNISEKLIKDFNTNFLYGYTTPDLIKNSKIYKEKTDPGQMEKDIKNSTYYKNCINEIKNDTTKSDTEKQEILKHFEFSAEDLEKELSEFENFDVGNEDMSCNSILGVEGSKILKNLFNLIKYLGPILVVVFTIKDFALSIFSGEQDKFKKSKGNFIKRLIAAILLFLIPNIVDLIFKLIGLYPPSSCIK